MSARIILATLITTSLLHTASAQVEMTFQLVNHEVLELESIPVGVTLQNKSTRHLRAGEDYQLAFDVTDPSGVQVRLRKERAMQMPAELAPGAQSGVTNDLGLLYQLNQQGPYTVAARLVLGQVNVVSSREFLDVLPGAEVAYADGVAPDGTARRYSLRQLSRTKQNRLFLRLDDPAASLCYGVLDLGRVIPMRPPELRVDQNGLAHVLHLTSPSLFVHSVFSADGDLVAQQTHAGDASRVKLEPDADSGYRVTGVGVSPPRDPFIDTLPGRKRL